MPRNRLNKRRRRGKALVRSPGMENDVNVTRFGPSGRGIPDSFTTGLRMIDTVNTQFTNNAVIYTSREYKLNDAYKPYASSADTVQGFSDLALLYGKFRVDKVAYDIWIANQEANPVEVVFAPTNITFGNDTSSLAEMAELPFARVAVLSAKGGQDRIRLRGIVPLGKLFGNERQYYSDPATAGTQSSSPTSLLYGTIGGRVLTGTFTTNLGLCVSPRFTYYIKFFARTSNTFALSSGTEIETKTREDHGAQHVDVQEDVESCAALLAVLRDKIKCCSSAQ